MVSYVTVVKEVTEDEDDKDVSWASVFVAREVTEESSDSDTM
jgi:hypothetical protein